MLAALLLALVAAPVVASPALEANGERSSQRGKKGCLDVRKPGDAALLRTQDRGPEAQTTLAWPLYKPRARADQKRWAAILAATPADQRTSQQLADAWDATQDPCFLYLRAVASSGERKAVDALRAAHKFLAADPTKTIETDREAILHIWENIDVYDLAFTVEARPDAAIAVRGQATFAGLGEGADADLERAYCETKPDRCAARPFMLAAEPTRTQLPIGRWALTIEEPFVFVDASGATATTAEQEIRVRYTVADGPPPTKTVRYIAPKPELKPEQIPDQRTPVQPVVVPPKGEERPNRRAPITGLAAGGVTAVTGGVLLGFGAVRWSAVRGRDLEDCDGTEVFGIELCRRQIGDATNLRSGGAAVLGVGVGALIASGLWWNPPRDARQQRRRLGVGLGVGAALTIAGSVGIAVTRTRFEDNFGNVPDVPTRWPADPGSMQGHTIAATGLGLGLGLAATSVIHWAVRSRASSRIQAAPIQLRAGAGLVLFGRF
jgi:hypothetical protein